MRAEVTAFFTESPPLFLNILVKAKLGLSASLALHTDPVFYPLKHSFPSSLLKHSFLLSFFLHSIFLLRLSFLVKSLFNLTARLADADPLPSHDSPLFLKLVSRPALPLGSPSAAISLPGILPCRGCSGFFI